MALFTPNNFSAQGYVPTPQPTPIMGQTQFTPPLQQPTMQPTMQSQQANNSSISWVQGEAGAKAYPVGAGNTVLLLDSENPVFYLKSTDNTGMPQPLRIFKFEEITGQSINQSSQKIDLENYITREEFEELEYKIDKLIEKNKRPLRQTTRREHVIDDEEE